MLETLRLIGWAIVLAFALWAVLRSLGFIPSELITQPVFYLSSVCFALGILWLFGKLSGEL
jgi:hypothetical protein